MTTQLAFTRRHGLDYNAGYSAPAADEEKATSWRDASSRHVAFTVNDPVPSPQLYYLQQQKYRREEKPIVTTYVEPASKPASKYTADIQSQASGSIARPRMAVAPRPMKKKPAKSNKPAPKPLRARQKPEWDNGVRTSTSLFDGSIKKSELFKARSGDRLREVDQENRKVRVDTNSTASKSLRGTGAWKKTTVKSLPSRSNPRPKDFVRLNMEKITGEQYGKLIQRQMGSDKISTQRRGSVFDRLSAPLVHKSLLRFRSPSPRQQPQSPVKVDIPSNSHYQLEIASPFVSSPPRATTLHHDRSPAALHVAPLRSSPRSQSRNSVSSRHSSPVGRSSPSHGSEAASRVFEVLDRNGRGRIGVEQILDGLRLLGLPATHNQVSDYVYLIHEGAMSTIDQEEWGILVGTLDAAQPESRSAQPSVRSQRSSPVGREVSPPRSVNTTRTSPPGSFRRAASTPRPSHSDSQRGKDETLRNHPETPELPADTEAWYMEAIQRRVDEMYERAEHAVSLRKETHASADMLEQAAAAVYQLKSSLFPLVEQAEATLQDIRCHRTTKLSTTLSSSDLNRVATRSDDLATMLLDDLLLDLVEDLNMDERLKTRTASQKSYVAALDSIMEKIQHLEDKERELIDDHYAHVVIGATSRSHDSPGNTSSAFHEPISETIEPISLPLGVLMDLSVDFEDPVNTLTKSDSPRMASSVNMNAYAEHDEECPPPPPSHSASMAAVAGSKFQRIEKNRLQFLRHRRIVESSLESTGMDQASVIELLADLLLDEIAEECANELSIGVDALTDTLTMSLL